MILRVIPLPTAPLSVEGHVCLALDVIRATTAAICLFDAGCSRLYLSSDQPDPAIVSGVLGPDCLLCAELADGSAPYGYHHEPSPASLSSLTLTNRPALLSTANGTPAIAAIAHAGARVVMLAALRNLSASVRCAVQHAQSHTSELSIVCAGRLRNTHLALEDLYCAGLMLQEILRVTGGQAILAKDDTAELAVRLANSFPSARAAMMASSTGQRFVEIGKEADVDICGEIDASETVPVLATNELKSSSPVELWND